MSDDDEESLEDIVSTAMDDEMDEALDSLADLRRARPNLRDPKSHARACALRAEGLRVRETLTDEDAIARLDQFLARVARLEALTGEGSS